MLSSAELAGYLSPYGGQPQPTPGLKCIINNNMLGCDCWVVLDPLQLECGKAGCSLQYTSPHLLCWELLVLPLLAMALMRGVRRHHAALA
jgi:hypothetical protein